MGREILFPVVFERKDWPELSDWVMKTDNSKLNEPYEFVNLSSLYQLFLAEREEILRHKWLLSERLGQDIGFERALLDWIRKHRTCWLASRSKEFADERHCCIATPRRKGYGSH